MLERMSAAWTKLIIMLAVVMACVYGVVLFSSNRLGRPDESRRVHHPDGFSIIAPRGFDSWVRLRDATRARSLIELAPQTTVGESNSFFVVDWRSEEPELEGKSVTFQGQPATASEKLDGKVFVFVMKFQRDGRWFVMSYKRPTADPILDGPWRAFLDSFRVEKPVELNLP